ncbi:Rieske (2Fe-2S) protein [Paracraurococcus lichenis]|uniref:Nitrite reductase (NAD(P)H) small subunit n=1 Tax=Paracraurococcus lichenis TaxID=3064888 RepID=A0ABT9E953_9PROT|nr:nitrite reductase (NAD(P)H) small subunit [Paracraurococcus sp. LOR1-02]MDO9712634.1 nitrite reductase (NAD(P)H) small subunit [Paracraurococcus sp. LOR1-02]
MQAERILGRLADIPPGEGRTFELDGERIAVFHTRAGAVFATSAACPHKGGPLADGLIGGTTVICPLHERVYDLATGRELTGSCDIRTYPVRLREDGTVLLAVTDAALAG